MSKPIPPRTSSRYYGQYSNSGDIHRLIQILMESCKIAVESKKPDTAQDRYDLAIEAYYQILTLRPAVALEQLVTEATNVLVDRFPSQLCMNEAIGLCDKAKGKTVKTQLKYLLKAQGVLENGLAQQDIGYHNDINPSSTVMGIFNSTNPRKPSILCCPSRDSGETVWANDI